MFDHILSSRLTMDIYKVLKMYFGYDEFRRGQEKLIRGVLDGRDVLGIMPTGGGKSLCYQLPAMLLKGVAIVISPLISLMKDQVDSLSEIGISATYINSSLEQDEISDRIKGIREQRYKIIYVAPERLNTSYFMNLAKDINISLVAIDEAHCISQWGHDFRPSYLEIPKFIQSLGTRPVVAAFTATATREIIQEIKELIGINNPLETITGFDRPNLFYQVAKDSNKVSYLLNYLRRNYQEESGIIYCATRKTVEALVKKLQDQGISAIGYHGGMESDERQKNQDDFIFNRVRIIVATNAFGMGIDKPDVRFVIHFNMPKNMEAYYQEAGRAGRDGEKSECILMYSPSDVVKQKLMIQNEQLAPEREALIYKNLQYLVNYCHTNDCLRNQIISYFGEEIEKEHCNYCGNCQDESEMMNITIESQKILSCVYRTNERYGASTVIEVLRGSKNKKIAAFGLDQVSTYGIMADYSTHSIREMIMTLVSKGYAHITTEKFPLLKLTRLSKGVLKGEVEVYHKKHLVEKKVEEKSRKNIAKRAVNGEFDTDLFEKLKELRSSIAKEKKLPPYIIFHDAALKEMAEYFPQNKNAFMEINGVGEKKYENYGEEFLQLIQAYCLEKGIENYGENIEGIQDSNIENINEDKETDRYERTYAYYLKGLSIKEIAQERGYAEPTIMNHLKKLQNSGRVIEWSRFIDDPLKEEKILSAIRKVGVERLKPIKEMLPEEISYEEIRLVIMKNQLG